MTGKEELEQLVPELVKQVAIEEMKEIARNHVREYLTCKHLADLDPLLGKKVYTQLDFIVKSLVSDTKEY